MAWSNYIEQQTQHDTASSGLNLTSEIIAAVALAGAIILIAYFLLRQWRKHSTKYKEESEALNSKKSWRLTNVIYWVIGVVYILAAFLKDADSVPLSLIARLVVVFILYLVLRELYCYVQQGKKDSNHRPKRN